MVDKMIKNTSKGLFKKLFSKDRISGVRVTDAGFDIVMEKSSAIEIPFENLQAAKVNFYFEKMTPYRTLTLVTGDGNEYSLDVDPYAGEIDEALKHFAQFQLKGDMPSSIRDISVVLMKGLNGYEVKLENGDLIVIKDKEQTKYPWDQLTYYRMDKPNNSINLKFQDNELFVRLSITNVTNLWLLMEILKRFAKEQ